MADTLENAAQFEGWVDLQVVVISFESLTSVDFQQLRSQLKLSSQVVAFASDQSESSKESIDYDSLYSVIPLNASPQQIVLTVKRAFEFAFAKAKPGARDLDAVYRKLFEATASLQNAENLQQLVERACREVAVGCGFNRSVLIVGDQKFRVHTAFEYFADGRQARELNELLGRPLVPFLPGSGLAQVGKGFRYEHTANEQSNHDMQHITVLLERQDGTVLGFLTLDQALDSNIDLAGVSEPIALLLRLVATLIETNSMRAQMVSRPDIRDQSHVERSSELRQAQERFSRLVSLSEDIIYLTDAQGRIVYLNETYTRLLGFARENYIGQLLDSALSDLCAETEASKRAISSIASRAEERSSHEIELFTKSGYRTTYQVMHHWIRQGHDIVAGQGIMRDMSEQKELKTQLARSERLGIAGRLASGAAHEINNPLQAISSHLSSLRELASSDDKALESISVVSDSVDRIRLIVRSLLDLQRTDHGTRKLDNINEIVEKAIALLSPQMRSAQVSVARHLEIGLPPAKMNAAEIEQVLLNLIINAISAMPEGGTLTVTTGTTDRSIFVRVADSGRGIPSNVLPLLFQPFSTHREQGGGLGLGLYLSRNIVVEHGGELTAESPPGAGAVFTMTLPITT